MGQLGALVAFECVIKNLVKLMRQLFFKIIYVMAVAAVLPGCSSQKAMRNAGGVAVPQATASSMAPMKYSWNTNFSAMLSAPHDIQLKALAACTQRGFDRAYMQSIAIDEDQATAYFSCRGSDQ